MNPEAMMLWQFAFIQHAVLFNGFHFAYSIVGYDLLCVIGTFAMQLCFELKTELSGKCSDLGKPGDFPLFVQNLYINKQIPNIKANTNIK